MFGSKRHRPPPPVLTRATANPSAATAAAAVFKQREPSNSLSSAAAAAALRARPTTPTNVAEVQTKRTLARTASVSSSGTAELEGRPSLRRRGSQGSMTERTFRSPSPHRPSSSGSLTMSQPPIYTQEGMPPVPSIPKDVDTRPTVGRQHRKANSTSTSSLRMGSPPLRLASQTLGMPGHASWFGGATEGDLANVRTSDAAMGYPPGSPTQYAQEREGRPTSRGSSVNFSYPARVRVGSPSASPVETRSTVDHPLPITREPVQPAEHEPRQERQAKRLSSESSRSQRPSSIASDYSLVYDPNSRRMVPRAELLALEQAVRDSSEKPTRPKKKKQAVPKTGTHLAQGTVARIKGTAVSDDVDSGSHVLGQGHPAAMTAPSHQREFESDGPVARARVTSPVLVGQRKTERQQPQDHSQNRRPTDTDASRTKTIPEYLPPGQPVRRMPSVVKEEPEESASEREERAAVTPQVVAQAIDAVPTKQTVFVPPEIAILPEKHDDKTLDASAAIPLVAAELPAGIPAEIAQVDESKPSETKAISVEPVATAELRRERAHSNSPVRTTRFGTVHQDNLTVKHSPPLRSISPMKSALKHQSPSRGASPSDDTSEASSSVNPREEPVSRKKSVRVSFDDENTVVVGESAPPDLVESPLLPSPQASRRPWYSNIGRSKRADIVPLEDDEVMKPRPALPSFGSIRDKKPKEPEERPLVRPLEPSNSPPLPASPALLPSFASVTEHRPELLGQSSDHAIGALLSHEQIARNEANISKFREPLPPVVTSIEGSGYVSDSSSSSEQDEVEDDTEGHREGGYEVTPTAVPLAPIQSTGEPVDALLNSPETTSIQETKTQAPEKATEANVPEISVSAPSPRLREESVKSYFVVPGGFPEDESDGSAKASAAEMKEDVTSPVRQVALEPVVQRQDVDHGAHQTPSTLLTVRAPNVDQSEDSESSIYSDAYEDLSDIEGDGFQSLDAVVESSIGKDPPRSIFASLSSTQAKPAPSTQPIQLAQPTQTTAAPTRLDPEEPKAPEEVDGQSKDPAEVDWEKAKAYWRSLTAEKRAQLEQEAQEEAGAEADLDQEKKAAKKPKKKKSVERRNSERKAIQERVIQERAVHPERRAIQERVIQERVSNPERVYMIQPGTRVGQEDVAPVMRTTMRGNQQPHSTAGLEKAQMRKSMRTDGPVRTTRAPQPQPRQSVAQIERPISYPAPGPAITGKPMMHGRTASDMSSQPASTGMSSFFSPMLKRRGSTSSESSFKRSRPLFAEGLGFRKTMRSATMPQGDAGGREAPSKFSLRGLSPNGSPFRLSATTHGSPPVSMSTNAYMRRTLRDGPEEQKHSKSRFHMPSFGLSSGSKGASKRRGSGSKFTSRFDNSSDEEEVPTTKFSSRFADDSSDEDDPTGLPPLTIPKTVRSDTTAAGTKVKSPDVASPALPEELEESDDLPDSGDDEKGPQHRLPASKTANLGATSASAQRSGSGRGQLATPQTSPAFGTTTAVTTTGHGGAGRPAARTRRSSLMAVLRRKKADPSAKIQRPELIDSAARRDTKLERSVMELTAIRSGERPGSPRLQKRVSGSLPARAAAGWPLPDVGADGKDEGGAGLLGGVNEEDEGGKQTETAETRLSRPSTSGNLGTRTLSGTGMGTTPRPGFLQRRTMSHGGLSLDGVGTGVEYREKRKKKFGALRRLFGLDD